MSVHCDRHPESNHEPWQCPGETREDRLETALRVIADPELTYEGGNPSMDLPSEIASAALAMAESTRGQA